MRQVEIICAHEGKDTLNNETGGFLPVLGGGRHFLKGKVHDRFIDLVLSDADVSERHIGRRMSEDLHDELDRLAFAVVIEEVAERFAHRMSADS